MTRPEVGDIAVCKHGHVGVVAKIVIRNTVPLLWKGYHIDLDDAGDPWQSNAPKKLLTLSDYLIGAKKRGGSEGAS